MYIVKAEAKQAEKIVDMSIRAFETDVNATRRMCALRKPSPTRWAVAC